MGINPKSPPFRYLPCRYPLSDLQEPLAEGIIVGHEALEMPQFQFSPGMIDALPAYYELSASWAVAPSSCSTGKLVTRSLTS